MILLPAILGPETRQNRQVTSRSQFFSYPHSPTNQSSSINYTIDPDMHLCTWATFGTICLTSYNLPPGSQASIRDIAEAYRTIPFVPEQWVVRL